MPGHVRLPTTTPLAIGWNIDRELDVPIRDLSGGPAVSAKRAAILVSTCNE
jgi:hypothetical protein